MVSTSARIEHSTTPRASSSATSSSDDALPQLGFGLGLRPKHYPHIFAHWPQVDWFEIISENFMDTDGRPKRNLARIKERYPIVMHGVALSIGTVDPLNSEYLQKLKALIDWVNPAWISDHLCWTGVAHTNTHDLLPVPYTEEALAHIVSRVRQVQDYLERPIALENPSTYLEFNASTMPEAEFIARLAEEANCRLLLDVNNVYVTCYNHRLDPKAYLDQLPLDRVVQIHLSGHSNKGTHIIDTHDDHVVDEVWALYRYVIQQAGRIPNTMVEWDDHIPEFDGLAAELEKAKRAAFDTAPLVPLPNLHREERPQRSNHPLSLHDAEQHMLDAIVQGEEGDSHPEQWIRAKENFSPAAQLAVYMNAYRYRLHDVTAEDYPVLQKYLGDDAFYALMWAFVNHARSAHFNIARFALQLPNFVTKHLPDDLFARELAILETTIAQLTDPEETPALTAEHLEGLTPERLMQTVLQPRTALQLLSFTYPVNHYYRAVQDEQNPTSPAPEASWLAVFRHEDVVWRMDLDAQEFFMLNTLFSGETVEAALLALQAKFDLDETVLMERLSDWFGRWMRNGLLTLPHFPEATHAQHVA